MKVKDLLEALKDAHPETDIWFLMEVGCCGDVDGLDDPTIEVDYAAYKPETPENQHVRIQFPCGFEILDSCIGSGTAHTAVLESRKRLGPEHPHFCSGCGHRKATCRCEGGYK